MTTLDQLTAILHKDPQLTPEQADALADLFRVAYDGMMEIKALQSADRIAKLNSSPDPPLISDGHSISNTLGDGTKSVSFRKTIPTRDQGKADPVLLQGETGKAVR